MSKLEKISALENSLKWYQEKAQATNRYLAENNHDALLAVLTELSLDNGMRAQGALDFDE